LAAVVDLFQLKMHTWNLSASEAVKLQKKLAKRIICKGRPKKIDCIAGADLAYEKSRQLGFCAVILFSYPGLNILDTCFSHDTVEFPYIPGLLTFREGPLFLKTFKKIKTKPDVIIFDGQGIAHPRKLGIAAHMGLFLNIPTIGCAKSKLYGSYDEPGTDKGAESLLYDKSNSPIGTVLRTRKNVKPVFISPGHKIGIKESKEIIMNCVIKYRIPEPVRIAHIEVGKYKNYLPASKNIS